MVGTRRMTHKDVGLPNKMHETCVHESCCVHDVFMSRAVCMGCVHDVCMTCGVHGMWVAWHG